jgi:Transposase DDE domain/Transposase domain (DUF772)
MSMPSFSSQSELFSTAGLSASLFPKDDRYRLFAKLVYPALASARAALASCYCLDNGRVAIEPVLMLGVSLLQELDGVPDRVALEMLRYHAGWNFALNRQLGDPTFHPTSLVNFRHRLLEHDCSALGFTSILTALEKAGLISRQSRQRLDSTQMFGRVARMSRLDCVRESLRLALEELEAIVKPQLRPAFWPSFWERYVDTQVDYRVSSETLARKLGEAGSDSWQLLEWLRRQTEWMAGTQVKMLARIFTEQFELMAGQPAARTREALTVGAADTLPNQAALAAAEAGRPSLPAGPAIVEPKAKELLTSERVQNPHDPEATYSVKGKGEKQMEHVGYKVQIAETVCEAVLAPREPTRNFIVGILTHAAYESDEAGAMKMEQEQARMGLDKPPVQYVDGAYVSAQKLVLAQAEGREIIGPALPGPDQHGRFKVSDFQVQVEERKAICPAGKVNTQCSRLIENASGKINYRFEFSTHCHDCSLRAQCVSKTQRHRTLVVGEYHTALQARRLEQETHAFKERMKHRNAIEGTQSELVRAHGLRHARYRGLAKARLQNYFIGAACNVKRWIRHEIWKLQQTQPTQAVALA